MEDGACNLFATAFMVGYALPTSITCQPSPRRPPRSPPHTLRVCRARFAKRKSRVQARACLADHALSFLAGFLDPNHVLIDELQWQLKSHRTIAHRFSGGRSGRKICTFFRSPMVGRRDVKLASADMLSSTEMELLAPCVKRDNGRSSNQATQRAEKKRLARQGGANTHYVNCVKMEQIRAKGILTHNPDEIQTYMKMKNQLRSKEKKAAVVQAKMEMVARKEKMKALEMERRARLRLFVQNMMRK